jgi:cell division protein ZapA
VEVEIFGSIYNVRAQAERSHLEALATIVDGRMREIASRVTTVDSTKIAVLTALNLAEELSRNRRGAGGERIEIDELEDRVSHLLEELERALVE